MMKANPGKYNNFAHAGVGTTPHLSGELFRLVTGVDMVHVPFPGAGPAIQSIVAGHTPIMFTTLAPAVPQVKAGNLRALSVLAAKRSPALPDVPTMEEAGFKDQEANTFVAALMPAGTPKPIVDLLYREIVAALKTPDVRARFAAIGVDPVGNTSEEFAAQIKAEIAKWGKVIQRRQDQGNVDHLILFRARKLARVLRLDRALHALAQVGRRADQLADHLRDLGAGHRLRSPRAAPAPRG